MLDEPYSGTPKTVLEIFRVALGPHGAQSWPLRKYVEEIVKDVRPRDYWSEALAIHYTVCGPRFRYTHDPLKVELVKSPEKMLHEIATRGVALGDCDDLAAFELAALSTVGVPGRVATGAFDYRPELAGVLGLERADKYGFASDGSNGSGVVGPFSHVWAEGLRSDGAWVILDPVAGPHTRQMRRRLRQLRYYRTR